MNEDRVSRKAEPFVRVIAGVTDEERQALTTAMFKAMGIVRDLAATVEPVPDDGICLLCATDDPDHRESCPYRRAVEWVKASRKEVRQ